MSDPILELLAAPPNPSMTVDETAVYAGGRRRLRRRTLRRTAVGVVGVVGVAAIAFGALGTGIGNDALPAGPSPSASSSGRVSAELLDGRYAVEVIPGAGADQPNVIFSSITNGKRTQLAGSSASPDVVSLGTGSGADGVMLGTAPADLAKSLTVADGGIQQDEALLPGTDYKAYALEFDNPSDVETYRGTIWMDDTGSGIVRDAMGNRLPSTKLAGSDTFFVAREAKVIGVFTTDGGSTKPLPAGPATMGYGEKAKGGLWSWRSVTLLPTGARSIDFTWSGDEYHSEVFVEQLPESEGVAAFADGSAVGTSAGPIVTKVTWTDKAGTRHTESVN
ncbi:hypothetical protein ACOCJ7_15890 [Knoellia sp. CPCC 206453]|uniref:hypothetical protein n=1 Tax=Knoellia pratensis TaxID=3404796 RepID=UPI0036128FC7